ncbi:sigma-70 family RNA polymerase sigma factor [uncultured Alistipes sp.]|uniref:sigma-70 family RNA polymerase sigma factor n=1 Tax=uncultured Alistipes sp. TaxID=538949 RepID=UPI0026116142|nr:sigma-70 family RNA polymerase sigma factor [uncultured Alistipes sp.]
MEKPTKILTAEEFDKLFSEKERFVRIACSYVNDIEAATDITTDGFMYLWEHRDKLDIDANIRGYIYNYIRTRCISFLRKRKSMLKAHSELYKKEQWRIESGINTLSNEELIGKLFESEIVEIYRRELAKMPMLTRNVFLASRLENMTYYQIAQKFNLTVRQVTSEIQRASLLLRTPLKDYLLAAALFFISFRG